MKVLKKASHIVTGWTNYLFNRERYSVEKRLPICRACEKKEVEFGVDVCGICGCPLAGLVRVREKLCKHPDGVKWPE